MRRKFLHPGAFVWLVALMVGLGLLAVVSFFLRGAGSTWEAPSVSMAHQAGDLKEPATNTQQPATSDSFLIDYDALVHDQAFVRSRSPAVGEAVGFLAQFGLILVLLYGSLRALKVLTLRRRGEASSSTQIDILETRYLSSNRALYLVGAGPKVLLLGGTDQQITFLAELEDGGWKKENGRGKREGGRGEKGDGKGRMDDGR